MSQIVGLAHEIYVPDIERIVRLNRVEFYVVLVAAVEGESSIHYLLPFTDGTLTNSSTSREVQLDLCRRSPFVPIEGGAPIEFLEGMSEREELKAARHAFGAIRRWCLRFADRVAADLIAFALLRHAGDDAVCFISGPVTRKIGGRLGYLYLPREMTVAVLHTEPEHLMTSLLTDETGYFGFDLSYFKDRETEDVDALGPYPGDLQRSMFQTYLMRPRRIGPRGPLPLRIDILAQGITDADLAAKKTAIEGILNDPLRSERLARDGTAAEETVVRPVLLERARIEAQAFREVLRNDLRLTGGE